MANDFLTGLFAVKDASQDQSLIGGGLALADFSKKQMTVDRRQISTTTSTNVSNANQYTTTSNSSKSISSVYSPTTTTSSIYAPQIAYYSPNASQTSGFKLGATGAAISPYLGGLSSNVSPALTPSLVSNPNTTQGQTSGAAGAAGGFDFDMLIIAAAAVAGVYVLTKL